MKKLLALVLALVMTLGLATVSTSAAYTDANDIDYTEAVDVMTAVGVFQGRGDSFAPKETLKRAEAAKLVAYLMLGNKTAESMTGSGTRFTDVPANHWAAGFIEYLASVGIVSGVGGGKFNPDGQVTAVQFAKMLLVALGYDAEIENFVGDGWSINIQKVANENDLFDGLGINANDAVTREQAAQMCLNDLKADMVEYDDKGTTVNVGGATVTTGVKNAKEKQEKNNHNYNNATGGTHDSTYQQLVEFLYGDDLKLTGTSDDMGRPANQWKYKTADVGTYANTGDLIFEAKGEVKKTKVYEVVGKTAADDLLANTDNDAVATEGDKAYFKVFVDGVEVTHVRNGGTDTSPTYTNIFGGPTALVDKNTAAAIGTPSTQDTDASLWTYYGSQFTGNGTTTQIYLKEDETGSIDLYTIVITNEYLVQATADYSSSRENVNVEWKTLLPWERLTGTTLITSTDNTIEQEDFDVSGVKKDDFLVVTYSAKEGSFQSVKAATTLEGEVTKYVANDTVTIDGTTYKYAKKILADQKNSVYTVGNKVAMITDGEYILRVDETNATKDFVYLQDLGTNSGLDKNVKAALYGTDGKLKTVDVKKLSTSSTVEYNASALNSIAGGTGTVAESSLYGWYTYSVSDDGAYTLKLVNINTNYTNNSLSYTLGSSAADLDIVDGDNVRFLKDSTGATQTVKANSKTVFIVLDRDDDITVYTGLANAPTITLKKNAANVYASYVLDDGFATYVFVDLSKTTKATAAIDDSTQSDDYLMVVKTGKSNYDTNDNTNVYHPDTVLFDGAISTKNVDGDTTLTKGVLYHKVKTDSKGYITDATAITDESAKDYAFGEGLASTIRPITFNNGTVTIGGTGYLMNSDNSIYLVIGKAADPAKDKSLDYTEYLGIGGAALESYLKGYNFTYNYYGVRHDDNSATLDALYVWVAAGSVTEITTNAALNTKYTAGTDTGSYAFDGSAYMTGDWTVKGNLTITGNLDLGANPSATGTSYDLVIDGGILNVDGSILNTAAALTKGDITVKNGGKLYVNGALVAHDLSIGCEAEIGGNVTLSGDLVIGGGVTTVDANKEVSKVTFKGTVSADSITVASETTSDGDKYRADVSFEKNVTASGTNGISVTDSDVSLGGTVTATSGGVTVSGSTVEVEGNKSLGEVVSSGTTVTMTVTAADSSTVTKITNDGTTVTTTVTETAKDGTVTVTETKTKDGVTTTEVSTTVTTAADFAKLLADENVTEITLGANITAAGTVEEIKRDLTIDLNGFDLTLTSPIWIANSELTVTNSAAKDNTEATTNYIKGNLQYVIGVISGTGFVANKGGKLTVGEYAEVKTTKKGEVTEAPSAKATKTGTEVVDVLTYWLVNMNGNEPVVKVADGKNLTVKASIFTAYTAGMITEDTWTKDLSSFKPSTLKIGEAAAAAFTRVTETFTAGSDPEKDAGTWYRTDFLYIPTVSVGA